MVVNRKGLVDLLKVFSPVITGHALIRALDFIKISTVGNTASFKGSNALFYIEASMPVEGNTPVNDAINYNILYNTVLASKDETLEMSINDERLVLTSKVGQYKSAVLGDDSFIDFRIDIDPENEIHLSDYAIKSIIDATNFVSSDPLNGSLGCVQVKSVDNKLTIISTDGFTLYRAEYVIENPDFEFYLNKSITGYLTTLIQTKEAKLYFNSTSREFVVYTDLFRAKTTTYNADKYPDVSNFFNNIPSAEVTLELVDLKSGLRSIKPFMATDVKAVKLDCSNNLFSVFTTDFKEAQQQDLFSMSGKYDFKAEGTDIEVMINGEKLQKALKVFPKLTKNISLYAEGKRPVLIRSNKNVQVIISQLNL